MRRPTSYKIFMFKKIEIKEDKKSSGKELQKSEKTKKWPLFGKELEGELMVDVYQTKNNLVIQSAIAGIKPENLEVSIENDALIIKGVRKKIEGEEEKNYFYQECYWGSFSRQIILPVEVDPSRAEAVMNQGVLTIRIPKIEREKKRKITIKEI